MLVQETLAAVRNEPPRGFGQVAGGVVMHPETHLWQIWMMVDGSYTFFGAYRDPVKVQGHLEAIINANRRRDTDAEREAHGDSARSVQAKRQSCRIVKGG